MKRRTEMPESPPIPAASTMEGRENQCISLAYDLVAERLRNGTASSAETTHFLKLGSAKERLEMLKLERELKLMEAKTSAIESNQHMEELYSEVLTAVKEYGGYDSM